MDGDDRSTADRLERSLAFVQDRDLDFITTKAMSFNDDGNIKSFPSLTQRTGQLSYSREILKFGNTFVHGTFFGKRNVFADLFYDEQYRTAQDYDFICRLVLSKKYKSGFLDSVTYYYRVDNFLQDDVGKSPA